MIKTTAESYTESMIITKLLSVFRKFIHAIASLGDICILSEDAIYKKSFIREYMPELYKQHTSELYMNCIFCANLVRSKCHRNCLKCCQGTYIHCSPLLPGLLHFDTRRAFSIDNLAVPWYYKETCSSFNRLPAQHYFKNLHEAFSSNEICNFEVLEGLEKGFSSGEKPCHICASVDYELYKKCSRQGDFDAFSPCHRIKDELGSFYEKDLTLQ